MGGGTEISIQKKKGEGEKKLAKVQSHELTGPSEGLGEALYRKEVTECQYSFGPKARTKGDLDDQIFGGNCPVQHWR